MSNPTQSETNKVKAILIGESNVGKSNIFARIISNRFDEISPPTLGAAFHTLNLTINSQKLCVELWDTAGQERYNSLTQSYSHGAKIVIFVYDITERDSFEALRMWYNRLHCSNSGQIFAVFANKEDLVHNEAVPLDEAKKFALSIKAVFKKTSAKEGVGIREGLEEICAMYLELNKGRKRENLSVRVDAGRKNSKKQCCK